MLLLGVQSSSCIFLYSPFPFARSHSVSLLSSLAYPFYCAILLLIVFSCLQCKTLSYSISTSLFNAPTSSFLLLIAVSILKILYIKSSSLSSASFSFNSICSFRILVYSCNSSISCWNFSLSSSVKQRISLIVSSSFSDSSSLFSLAITNLSLPPLLPVTAAWASLHF